ncbi:acyl-CoA thioesterase [Pelagibius sp. CAU 1746]|uniref:acyl-CoA thioesterase n=1 Tax=Pelagibius sp. CAU 1746 TaxID=3140370 RepID=UPI00325AA157
MPSENEMPPQGNKPRGGLSTRTLAMPADANPNGDIFGGWVLSQMDIAAGIAAGARARGRVATVAVDAMVFHLPVYVGDVLGTYTEVIRVGRTSMAIHVEAWALRGSISASGPNEHVRVTQGTFTLVAIDDNGRPRPVPEGPVPPAAEEGAA